MAPDSVSSTDLGEFTGADADSSSAFDSSLG